MTDNVSNNLPNGSIDFDNADMMLNLLNYANLLSDMQKAILVELEGNALTIWNVSNDFARDIRPLIADFLIDAKPTNRATSAILSLTEKGRIVTANIPHCIYCHLVFIEKDYIQHREECRIIGCPNCSFHIGKYTSRLEYRDYSDCYPYNAEANFKIAVGYTSRRM
jgi:hypothetical protein